MSRELVTPGSPITWAYLDRSFGGRAVELLKVGDGLNGIVAGAVAFKTPVDVSGALLTRNGLPVLAGNPFLIVFVTGHNGAGSVTVAGAVKGDKVVSVIDLTAAPAVNVTADFESTITVAGHIQQTSTNLSASTALMITLAHQT